MKLKTFLHSLGITLLVGGGLYSVVAFGSGLSGGGSGIRSVGGVTWPLEAPDGTAGAPSYSFENDTDTGLYRSGNNLYFSINSTLEYALTPSALYSPVSYSFQLTDGSPTASTPTYTFYNDSDTGFYRSAADEISISLGAVARYKINSTLMGQASSTGGAFIYGGASATNPTVVPRQSDDDTGLGSSAAGNISLIANGVEAARIVSDGTTDFKTAVTSSKTCATDYTRISPNFCLRTANYSTATALTRDSCTTVTLPATDANAVLVEAQIDAKSANAGGTLRYGIVGAYGENTCSGTLKVQVIASVYEFSAVTSGTTIAQGNHSMIAPGDGTNFYLLFNDDSGNQAAADYVILGYYD